MNVYKRPGSKFWHYEFEVNGQRYRASTKRTKKVEAEKVAEDKRREVLNVQQLGALPTITLGDAAEKHLIAKKGEEAKDYPNLIHGVRKLFGEKRDAETGEVKRVRFGLKRDAFLHGITQADIDTLVEQRRAEGMKQNTINKELSLIQAIMTRFRKTYLTNRDLEFKRRRVKGKLRWLRPDEEAALLAALDPTREENGLAPYEYRKEHQRAFQAQLQDVYDLTVFLLDTGARYSEIATIPWDVVSMNERTINIYRSKVENESVFDMSERLWAVVQRRYRERRGPFVFTGIDGGVRKASAAAIRNAITRAGLNTPDKVKHLGGRATAHTLRDTYASKLAQTGKVTLQELQEMLGHSSPVMTQKYAHLIPRNVARKVASVLNELAAA